jgi:hypothetical protein
VVGAGVSMLRPSEQQATARPVARPSRTVTIEEAIAEEVEATP